MDPKHRWRPLTGVGFVNHYLSSKKNILSFFELISNQPNLNISRYLQLITNHSSIIHQPFINHVSTIKRPLINHETNLHQQKSPQITHAAIQGTISHRLREHPPSRAPVSATSASPWPPPARLQPWWRWETTPGAATFAGESNKTEKSGSIPPDMGQYQGKSCRPICWVNWLEYHRQSSWLIWLIVVGYGWLWMVY